MTVSRPTFDLSGGDLALDLANTLSRRRTPEPREDLQGYDDLVAWGLQTHTLTSGEAAGLRRGAAANPRAARTALLRAREVREAVFDVFSALAEARPVPSAALARLNAALPDVLARLRLQPTGAGADWAWNEGASLDRVVWPAVRAAGDLLTGPDRERIRECGARDCAWLFVDRSRNGTRRWCDMAVCGNREKARRFQSRSRAPRG